ncbi:MAG TPA: DUF4292 domain-containing protein [Bacteroidales bacterium]
MNRLKLSHPIYLTLLLTFMVSGFYGCRSSKDIAKKPTENEVKHLEQLISNDTDFGSLDSKVEFKFIPKEGVSAGMKGTLKMRRDSCMIFSVQPFAGIEAVKCMIRKDSFFIVSRLHKTYAVEDLSQLKNARYLNMELVQAILSNNIFVPGVTKPTEKDLNKFEWHKVKEGNYFRWPDENYLLDFCINEDGQYNELRASNPENKEKIKVSYNSFEKRGFLLFPNQVTVSVEGLKQTLKVQITYLKTEFNTPTNFKFEIPSKYKKLTTDELIKRFQSML